MNNYFSSVGCMPRHYFEVVILNKWAFTTAICHRNVKLSDGSHWNHLFKGFYIKQNTNKGW